MSPFHLYLWPLQIFAEDICIHMIHDVFMIYEYIISYILFPYHNLVKFHVPVPPLLVFPRTATSSLSKLTSTSLDPAPWAPTTVLPRCYSLVLGRVHPWRLRAGTWKWWFGSDIFPFQKGDFQVPAVNFAGSTWMSWKEVRIKGDRISGLVITPIYTIYRWNNPLPTGHPSNTDLWGIGSTLKGPN